MSKKLRKQLEKLEEQRKQKHAEMTGLISAVETENRDLTDEESEQFDSLHSEVADLDKRIERLQKMEQVSASGGARAVTENESDDDDEAGTQRRSAYGANRVGRKSRQKGTFFARQAHALFVNDGNRQAAAQYVESQYDDKDLAAVLRAPSNPAMLSDSDYAGVLDTIEFATSEFIDLLRPLSIMARFPGRRMQFDAAGTIKITRRTGKAAGGYVGEGSAIPVKQGGFDSISLTPKKIAVITAASSEQLAHSSPSLEALLRDDMLESTAEIVDGIFVLGGAGTTIKPAGLDSFTTPITAAAGATYASAVADMKAAIQKLSTANVPMRSPVWLMNSAQFNALEFFQDGNGNFIFSKELSEGKLRGHPFLVSNTVTAGNLFLVDGSFVAIAEDLAPTMDVSEDATLHFDDAPSDTLGSPDGVAVAPQNVGSLWQRDLVGIRLRWRHDWNMRQAAAVAHVASVNW